jgi:hypothetical protein
MKTSARMEMQEKMFDFVGKTKVCPSTKNGHRAP